MADQDSSGGRSAPPNAALFERELRTLAQAMGIKRMSVPEADERTYPHSEPLEAGRFEDILDKLNEAFDAPLQFPVPSPQQLGLNVPEGFILRRIVPAIYQAWRLKSLTERYGGRVIQIGAGCGHAAFYAATAAGITDYTIVDSTAANVIQANFLGGELGQDRICLFGETHRPGQIKIMPWRWFSRYAPTCDVALCVEGLSTMPISGAEACAEWAMSSAKVFLSMSLRESAFVVHDLPALAGHRISRSPVMVQPEYVEEVYEAIPQSFSSADS